MGVETAERNSEQRWGSIVLSIVVFMNYFKDQGKQRGRGGGTRGPREFACEDGSLGHVCDESGQCRGRRWVTIGRPGEVEPGAQRRDLL